MLESALAVLLTLQETPLKVTLEDGSKIDCKVQLKSVSIETDKGVEEVPIEKVKELAFSKLGDELTTTEATLKGRIKWDEVKATSEQGMLTLWKDKITKIEVLAAPKPQEKEYEIPDMGLSNEEHDSACHLGGGRVILDFQRQFHTTRQRGGVYGFDLKGGAEGRSAEMNTCRRCQGMGWALPGYDAFGPHDGEEECPHCGEKGSISIWKGTMRLCLSCGRSY
jgi:hypothetical protein